MKYQCRCGECPYTPPPEGDGAAPAPAVPIYTVAGYVLPMGVKIWPPEQRTDEMRPVYFRED